MTVLYTSPAAALQEWHQTISPATFDFFTQENGTADLHLDPSVVASGITVEYEQELESSRSEIEKALTAFNAVKRADINFELAATGSAPWVEDDGPTELWGDPATWGVAGATLRIIVQSCPSSCDGLPNGGGGGFCARAEAWCFRRDLGL